MAGVVDTVIESAKTGVDVVGAVAKEGVGGVNSTANEVIDLGQELKDLVAEGGELTVEKAANIMKDWLDRIGRVMGG